MGGGTESVVVYQAVYLLKHKLAFVPPKPKLFDSATLTSLSWATFGT
jgi:hypothetical protein